jgi:hypothetical protein
MSGIITIIVVIIIIIIIVLDCEVSVHEPGSNCVPQAHFIVASGKYISN